MQPLTAIVLFGGLSILVLSALVIIAGERFKSRHAD
jgi:hypothetical protein